MLPLTVGFLIAGPLSGYLSDRFGARPFATGGMVVAAASFALLELLPAIASWLRGGKYHYTEPEELAPPAEQAQLGRR